MWKSLKWYLIKPSITLDLINHLLGFVWPTLEKSVVNVSTMEDAAYVT